MEQIFFDEFVGIQADDCIAIDFSGDMDKPNKWQDKDGNWHVGVIENE